MSYLSPYVGGFDPPGLPWEEGGVVVPYDPASEAGLILDLWAEAGITEAGTGVSSWVEGVASVNFAQGADGNRPTFSATGLGGRPAVNFVRANSDRLTSAGYSPSGTTHTFIFAMDPGGIASAGWLFDNFGGRLILGMPRSAVGDIEPFLDAWVGTGVAMTTPAQVLRLVIGGTGANQSELFRDGVSLATFTAANAITFSGTTTFGSGDGGASPFDGWIGRFIHLNTLDNDRDVRIEDWMSDHYGTP